MSVKIRMARGGAKKRPYFRIVVADSHSPRDGRFIERIGSFDPMLPKDDPKRVVIDVERAKHWLSHGATPSERVARFLSRVDLVPAPVIREQPKQSQPRPKTVERMKAKQEAREAAAKAAAEPPAEPAAEAPAEPAAEAPAEPAAEPAPEA
jgi:small subunit ribosomal protein S16